MKILVHLVRDELRRLRGWLLAWCLIQSLGLLALATSSPGGGAKLFASLARVQPFADALWAFFLCVEIWAWVAPLGAERFWTTRPISMAQVSVSRLVVIILVLGVFPVCMSLPAWVYWNLDHVQYVVALKTHLLTHGAALLAALTACVLNPKLSEPGSRVLMGLLTLFLIGVPFQLLLGRPYSERLFPWLNSIPIQSLSLVFVGSLCLAIVILYVRRSRVLAISSLLGLPCLSLPLISLMPKPQHHSVESSVAVAALGGLEALELRQGDLRELDSLFLAKRQDARGGPLSVSFSDAALLHEGRMLEVTGSFRTERINEDLSEIAVYAPGERVLQGTLRLKAEGGAQSMSVAVSSLKLLTVNKPLVLRAECFVFRLETLKIAELQVDSLEKAAAQEQGAGPLHARHREAQGLGSLSVYDDFRPFTLGRDGDLRFVVYDSQQSAHAYRCYSDGYTEFSVLGVNWRSSFAIFSGLLGSERDSTRSYQVIEYRLRSIPLGNVHIEEPVFIKRSSTAAAASN